MLHLVSVQHFEVSAVHEQSVHDWERVELCWTKCPVLSEIILDIGGGTVNMSSCPMFFSKPFIYQNKYIDKFIIILRIDSCG